MNPELLPTKITTDFQAVRKEIYNRFVTQATQELQKAQEEYTRVRNSVNKLFPNYFIDTVVRLARATYRQKLLKEIAGLSYRRGPSNPQNRPTLFETASEPSDTKRTLLNYLSGTLPDGRIVSISQRQHFVPRQDTAKKVWLPTAIEYTGTVKRKNQKEKLITTKEARKIYKSYRRILEEIDGATRAEIRKREKKI